ncbi:MAG: hypothetical protein ACRD1K_08385 [Acidimicrobiales bacterium]
MHPDSGEIRWSRPACRRRSPGCDPKEHRLVRHLAGRNRDGGGGSVLCPYDELVGGGVGRRHRRAPHR